MDLVAIEPPTLRVPRPREALELGDAALRMVVASQGVQVIADELVETLS